MSRATTLLLAAALACAAGRAQAQAAPDSTLEGYVRSMADSTDAWFGLSAAAPDTAGLDSARAYWAGHPEGKPARRAAAISFAPAFNFNRTLGAAPGAAVTLRLPGAAGRLTGRAQHAAGARLWLGSGGWALRRADRASDDEWSAGVSAGRLCERMDRDFADELFRRTGGMIAGNDRSHYLRRDGLRATLARRSHAWWGGLEGRIERESPLATTATWTLTGVRPEVIHNDTAAAGRVRELAAHLGARLPLVPFSVDAQVWNASGYLGGELKYTRVEGAVGGAIALGRHLALAPQAEYARLTGSALPQDALYLGGATLRSLEPGDRQGTGRALGRAELVLTEPLQKLLGVDPAPMLPLQLAAFAGAGAVWGTDPVTGRAALTRRDAPRAEEWLTEAGVSLLFRPGLPRPDLYLRLDWAAPLGPGHREPRLHLSGSTALDFLRPE